MKNPESWKPTKAELHNGAWRASRDLSEVSEMSRLVVDLGVPLLAGLIEDYARGDLLDVGCGKVPFYGMYRDRTTSVTTTDWGESVHESPHIDIEADLSQPLPFPDASFDTVLATDVLEHLAYPEAFWAQLQRVLRPGGRVLMTMPFLYALHETPHDHHRYTIFRLRRFCDDHGFRMLREHAVGGPRVVYADLTLRFFGRRMPGPVRDALRRAAMRAAQGTEAEDGWPLGYSFAAERTV